MALYRSIQRFALIYRVEIATMYFKRAIASSYCHHQGNVCRIAATTNLALSPSILSLKSKCQDKEKATSSMKFGQLYRTL